MYQFPFIFIFSLTNRCKIRVKVINNCCMLSWISASVLHFRPLNLLDGYKNRFAYSLAFGVTTSYCISIIFYDSQSVLGEKIGKIIVSSPSFVGSK